MSLLEHCPNGHELVVECPPGLLSRPVCMQFRIAEGSGGPDEVLTEVFVVFHVIQPSLEECVILHYLL